MHPALVITDQKLPGIQGIAFARLVRKRFPRMPIILCSSCSAMHDAQSCHMGADEDIQRFVKPFDPQRLKEAVDRALVYAYRDRRKKKGEFRTLWITRINAACRMHGFSYSGFMAALKKAGVEINRKVLADLAVRDMDAFAKIAEVAKAAV